MLRNIFLVYALIVVGVFAWQTWHGHQIGNNESAGWSSRGASQYHK